MPAHYTRLSLLICALGLPLGALGNESLVAGSPAEKQTDPVVKATQLGFYYGEKGLEFETADSSTSLWLGLRLQFRYDSEPGNAQTIEQVEDNASEEFKLQRGRIKGGGHVFAPWLQVYTEADFVSDTWLDYRGTLEFSEQASLRLGQWKIEYNRERIDSSGAQQLVDRSISNYWFTLDRQLGAALMSRFWKGSAADMSVWLEGVSGNGLDTSFRSGSGLGVLRCQWNPMGEALGFSQADLKRRKQPLLGIALGGVAGKTEFSRFSSSGGGQLPGLSRASRDLTQLMLETTWHYRGLSWQQELHGKWLESPDGSDACVVGGYVQGGCFPEEWIKGLPRPLELTCRLACVDPDQSFDADRQGELMLGANWYFDGHRNKISADLSSLSAERGAQKESELRFRLQWDVSL